MLLIFVTLIKTDSLMFNLSNDNDEEALILIDKLYH